MKKDWKGIAKALGAIAVVEGLSLITNNGYYECTAQDLERRADKIESGEKQQNLKSLAREFHRLGSQNSIYPNPRLFIPLEPLFSGNYARGQETMGYNDNYPKGWPIVYR